MKQPFGRRIRLVAIIGFCTASLAACANQAPRAALNLPLPPPPAPVMPTPSVPMRLSAMPPIRVAAVRHPAIDLSGRSETGRASFYGRRFAGRRTASGRRFNPDAATAASKTLPIGTVAKVVNLSNGASTTVTVNDRGPNVASRMLDVSPEVAVRLGMKHSGIADVLVEPIAIPEPDGTVKLGAGAAHMSPEIIQTAVYATQQLMRETGIEVAER